MQHLRRNVLTLLALGVLGGGIFADVTWVLYRHVFAVLCDDEAYRDIVLRGLGTTTFVVGSIVGLIVGCVVLDPRLEPRLRWAIGIGTIGGLLGAAVMLSFTCATAFGVALSRVSLSMAFRPWWRTSNWILALIAFLVVGAGTFSAAQTGFRLAAPRR